MYNKSKYGRAAAFIGTLIMSLVLVFTMSAAAFADSVTSKDALKIALKNAKCSKSQVKRIDVDYDDEDNTYEVEFVKKKNKAEFDYEISASDGTIIEKSVDFKYKHNRSRSKIGKKAARKKVAKISGISLSVIKKGSCKYEYDDREGKYTVKFTYKNRRYEYEVLAPNGKITEYEWKVIK